jgi:hypothetical protein
LGTSRLAERKEKKDVARLALPVLLRYTLTTAVVSWLNEYQESDLLEVVKSEPTASQPMKRVALRRNDFQTSTKLEALLRNLRAPVQFF